MNGKLAFVIGAGLGYVLGTRAGREQYEKLKSTAKSALEHPVVKDRVAQAETLISDAVREQGAKVTDQVANLVKDRLGKNGSAAEPTPAAGSTTTWDTPSR